MGMNPFIRKTRSVARERLLMSDLEGKVEATGIKTTGQNKGSPISKGNGHTDGVIDALLIREPWQDTLRPVACT